MTSKLAVSGLGMHCMRMGSTATCLLSCLLNCASTPALRSRPCTLISELIRARFQMPQHLFPTTIQRGLTLAHVPCRSHRETDRPFPEPALFVVNPQGNLHIVEYSNSPFARPDIRILIAGAPLISCSALDIEPLNPVLRRCEHCGISSKYWVRPQEVDVGTIRYVGGVADSAFRAWYLLPCNSSQCPTRLPCALALTL